jgi:hypothetical protein
MADIQKHIVRWHGVPGQNPVSVLYCIDGFPNLNNNLRQLFSGLGIYLPNTASITMDTTGDILDSETGAPTGSWSNTAVSTVNGAATGAYASGVGALVYWNTGTVIGRRRLRGKTFMVPLVGHVEANGSLSSGFLTTFGNVCDTYVNGTLGSSVVWHRPVDNAGGSAIGITGWTVNDRPAFLSSRRV